MKNHNEIILAFVDLEINFCAVKLAYRNFLNVLKIVCEIDYLTCFIYIAFKRII